MNRGLINFWAALAFILIIGIGSQLLRSSTPWRGEVAAAWVQAVGSIAAIIAAIIIARAEARRAHKERRALVHNTTMHVLNLSIALENILSEAESSMVGGRPGVLDDENFDELLFSLRELPIANCSSRIALALTDLRRGVVIGKRAYSVWREGVFAMTLVQKPGSQTYYQTPALSQNLLRDAIGGPQVEQIRALRMGIADIHAQVLDEFQGSVRRGNFFED